MDQYAIKINTSYVDNLFHNQTEFYRKMVKTTDQLKKIHKAGMIFTKQYLN